MRCLIFTGGDLFDPEWHRRQIKSDDYILCADKGAEYIASMGIKPQMVVGDMDSLDESIRQNLLQKQVAFQSFPSEKDETDTELALIEAIKLQPKEIVIFAGTGDRLDHSLANIFLLAGYLWTKIPITLVNPLETLRIIDGPVKITGFPQQVVSLLSITPVVKGLTLKGFYYPLEKAELPFGTSKGISNVLLKREGIIELTEGNLLIVQQNK